jgi:hypothetical protein
MKKIAHPFSSRSLLNGLIVAATLVLFVAGQASAQTTTSPQGGAAIYTSGVVCGSTTSITTLGGESCATNNDGNWFNVMTASLKSNSSSSSTLFVSTSLITGLYTNTSVKGNGSSQTAQSTASVSVRVLLDCTNCGGSGAVQNAPSFAVAAFPNAGNQSGYGVTFDSRIQQLTATLGQAITSTCIVDITTCSQEQIQLILETTGAHAFNFFLLNVGSGAHSITVQVRLNSDAGTGVNTSLASSVAAAYFGLGSMTVMPVHLAPGFTF